MFKSSLRVWTLTVLGLFIGAGGLANSDDEFSSGGTNSENLPRFLNTLGVLFDPLPAHQIVPEEVGLDVNATIAAMPPIDSPFEKVSNEKTPPFYGVPRLQFHLPRVSFLEVNLNSWVFGSALEMREDIFKRVESFRFWQRSLGVGIAFTRKFGLLTLQLPVTFQDSVGSTRGHLISEYLKTKIQFRSLSWGSGFGLAYQRIWGSVSVFDRRSTTSLEFGGGSGEPVVTESGDEPSRYSRMYQAGIGLKLTDRLSLSFSEVFNPGVVALPRVLLNHRIIF